MIIRILFLAFFLSTTFNVAGQSPHSNYKLHRKSSESYNWSFIHIFPNDTDLYLAYENLVKIYSENRDTTRVKFLYLNFISKKLTTKQNNYLSAHRVLNIPHKYYKELTTIYLNEHKYDSALYCLYKADTVYRYFSGCGNGDNYNKIELACKYAEIFSKLNKPDLAIQSLLKEAYNQETTKHIKMLKSYLLKFDKKKLQKEIRYSIKNVKINPLFPGPFSSGCNYYKTFLNNKISFRYSGEKSDIPTNEIAQGSEMTSYLMQSQFYKMVTNL
ncbi:MAG: hypothetical protein K9G49_14530 [Taibaiella sp.]|nr:hypothetical protein [Taibaiella sp.]